MYKKGIEKIFKKGIDLKPLKIMVEKQKPKQQKIRNIPLHKRKIVEQEISKLIDKNVCKKLDQSPYLTNIVLIKESRWICDLY